MHDASLNFTKSVAENYAGRWWVELVIYLDAEIVGIEFFSDVHSRGAEVKTIARINYVIGESAKCIPLADILAG